MTHSEMWGLGAAIALLVGVWLLNLLDESRHRRRAREAFHNRAGSDVLLDEPPLATNRQEPRFEEPDDEPPLLHEKVSDTDSLVERRADIRAGVLEAEIDYIVTLQLEKAVSAEELRRAQQQTGQLGRLVLWEGLNELSGWELLDSDHAGSYLGLRAGLQLASRAGPIDLPLLSKFCDTTQYLSDRWLARIQFPDRKEAVEKARRLDAFCAEVDVVIGLNLISREGVPIALKRVGQLAEEAGMVLVAPNGWRYEDDAGRTLFALGQLDGGAIDKVRWRQQSSLGLTFTLDIPKVPGGLAVFDRVTALARHFAQQLNAELVDDQRNVLIDTNLDGIRRQLGVIYSNMELRGLSPGSPLSIRVFS